MGDTESSKPVELLTTEGREANQKNRERERAQSLSSPFQPLQKAKGEIGNQVVVVAAVVILTKGGNVNGRQPARPSLDGSVLIFGLATDMLHVQCGIFLVAAGLSSHKRESGWTLDSA